jgi:16S rRNA (uracil1498-N3)-methyltransferase
MDLYRFYVPDLVSQFEAANPGPGHALTTVRLPDDQAHHARSVLRLEERTPLVLFDGKGAWCEANFTLLGKRDAVATPRPPLHHDSAPPVRLTLAPAVPKGERAEWLVDQASQLYVSRLQWLSCDRGVVKPREGGAKVDKWRRIAVESAKQCGRTHLMAIDEPLTLEALLAATPATTSILWLDPRATDTARTLLPKLLPAGGGPLELLALIGPEGGWSPREEALVRAAATSRPLHALRLTPTVLRIETAASTLAAVLLAT